MSAAILVVKTKSGSVYHVDPVNKTCKRMSGGAHYYGRASVAADSYRAMTLEIGQPMGIHWGSGRDEFSPDDGLPDEPRERYTHTSDVVSIEPLVDCG